MVVEVLFLLCGGGRSCDFGLVLLSAWYVRFLLTCHRNVAVSSLRHNVGLFLLWPRVASHQTSCGVHPPRILPHEAYMHDPLLPFSSSLRLMNGRSCGHSAAKHVGAP